tara:strand:+ start:6984 stop:7544 length:561 start_codon:yes stop_codon:yes gene_type:complete
MGGESPSGGGGSSGPVGVTFRGNKISKQTRKDKQRRGGREVDALSQPMAGSKSADPFSVSSQTSNKSTESSSGIGFRTDESGQQYAVRIDRATGKTRSYAGSGTPSRGDRINYQKALDVERQFKAGKKMTDSELDALFGMEDGGSSQSSSSRSSIEPKRKSTGGPSAASRRLLAQGQMGQKTRQFY